MRKILELLLIAVAMVGGILAWRTGQERTRLGEHHARLARKAGDFAISDPTRIHVLALDTGEALHYAWRVYLPPGCTLTLRNPTSSMNTWDNGGVEFIARLRIREDDRKGRLRMYWRFAGTSNVQDLGDSSLANLVRDHEGEILAETLGSGKVAVVDPDRSSFLLKLSLPENLKAKVIEPSQDESKLPDFFWWEFGPQLPLFKANAKVGPPGEAP